MPIFNKYTAPSGVTVPSGKLALIADTNGNFVKKNPAGVTQTLATVEDQSAFYPKNASPRYTLASLPRWVKALSEYRSDLFSPIVVLGMGSSVGNGATLPSPSTQAPLPYLATQIKSFADKLNIINMSGVNRSVDGFTVFQGVQDFTAIIASYAPKLVVLAYGMNDGATAQFNAGQTFGGLPSQLRGLIHKCWAIGSDVIIMTTPHPHTVRSDFTMPAGVPMSYPYSVAANVPNESLVPPVSQSVVTGNFLNLYPANNIPASHRHYRVNQVMRQVAVECGVPCIDVEKYWFEAVLKYGQDALYNSGEYVHPNLLGHQQSYHLAIDDFVSALYDSHQLSPQAHLLNWRVAINADESAYGLRVRPLSTDGVVSIEKSDGTKVLEVVSDGTVRVVNSSLVTGGTVRHVGEDFINGGIPDAVDKIKAIYNISAAIDIPLQQGATLFTLYAHHSGGGDSVATVLAMHNGTSVSIAPITSNYVGASDIATISASGANIRITPNFSNSDIRYKQLSF